MPIRKSKLESIQGYRPYGSAAETEETSGVRQAKVRQEKLDHIPGYSRSAGLTVRAEERMRQREAGKQAFDKLYEATRLSSLPGSALAKLPGMMLGATEQPRKRTSGAVLIESDPERARVYDDELQKYAGTPGELKRQLRESQARDAALAADWNEVELGNPDPTAKTQYLNEKYGSMDTYKKRVAESAARTAELTAWLQQNRNAAEAAKWEQVLDAPDAKEMIERGMSAARISRPTAQNSAVAAVLTAYKRRQDFLSENKNAQESGNWEKEYADTAMEYGRSSQDSVTPLAAQLTENEAKVLAYYVGKGDWENANRYYAAIADLVNRRAGLFRAKELQMRGGFNRVTGGIASGVQGGFENYMRNVGQNFTDEIRPRPASYYTTAEMARWANEQDHTAEKYSYLVAQNIGDQLPSILVSYLTSGALSAVGVTGKLATTLTQSVQSLSVGMGAAGAAYGQALAEGYSRDKARTYGVLVGASEAALESVLSGVGAKVGITDEILLGKIRHIEKGLARVALSGAVRIAKDEIGENLQNYLEPLFRTILFGEKYQAPSAQETIETVVVTFLTTLLTDAENIAKDISDARSDARGRAASQAQDTADGGPQALPPRREAAEALQRQDELALRRWEEQTRAQALDQMVENLQNGRMPSGLPVEISSEGEGQYVQADRQVMSGNDPASWPGQLENYISGKILQGEEVHLTGADGDVQLGVMPGGELSGESTRSGRTRFIVYFRDAGGECYKATISAARNTDGGMIYSVGKVETQPGPDAAGPSR